jgi:superfamily II DNA or RNA helicase
VELLQLVRVRRQRWRVADIRRYESCQLLTLRSAEPGAPAVTRQLLTPYDEVETLARVDRPRIVGRRLWRRACRSLLAADAPPGTLRTAARAAIDLLPHQLEPALAVVRGRTSRVLLADDVGLGKTIQAGLIVAELLARSAIERVLVVTPAGVRDQWAAELSTRFGIDATLVDARALRQRTAALPVGVNPWSTIPIAVASVDYVKRPEVLPAVRVCRWDAIVVDEAHVTAGDSERHDAIHALASRSPYVLLLTATPHNGDPRAFSALCDLGRIDRPDRQDDPPLIFRRTRRQIRGDAVRRVHTLAVRPTDLEERMHAQLAAYRRAVRDEHGDRALALSVLDKRAFSSPWALAQSVDRRLGALAAAGDEDTQLPLPLDDPEGELATEDEPPAWPEGLGLADAGRERRLLLGVLDAACSAAIAGESKVRALARLVRRAGEPIVVFTEYRDTAQHLHAMFDAGTAVLHGGLSRAQRQAVLDRFSHGDHAVLIATDAAGQGLNLHHACRIVVNLELPWNPMRLEQRIGRVDRIGQTRAVHAFHLVGRRTGEERILSRLKDRIDTARAAANAPDPIGSVGRSKDPFEPRASDESAALTAAAASEAPRLAEARRFVRPGDDESLERLESARPGILRGRRRRLRAALGGRTLFIFRVAAEDATGRLVESRLVPLAVHGASLDPSAWPSVPQLILQAWRASVADAVSPFWTRRLIREHAMADAHEPADRMLFQGTLFDRHADRDRADEIAGVVDARLEDAARLADLTFRATIASRQPELLLVVVP